MISKDTIIALATPSGTGAIAVIRLSGKEAIPLVSKLFRSVSNKDLKKVKTHTIHLGYILDGDATIDKVLASVFKGPNSYTGEDVVEISCHGSIYIQQQIIQLFIRNGCRMANAGEFTMRAFLNGKMDLSQAEAVADLIASENEASHKIAIQQMRGGFSNEIKQLREELLNFASLIELELDFAEEDVEFADRKEFQDLLNRIENVLKSLIDSFALGNVIKSGIPIAIVGEPNVGKSTLLNALLKEERAIVSEIAGTTRDTIEDEITIGGIGFRFIDTAGIRETMDKVERIGIERTYEKMEKAEVVLFLISALDVLDHEVSFYDELKRIKTRYPSKPIIALINKTDLLPSDKLLNLKNQLKDLFSDKDKIEYQLLSAKTGLGIEELKSKLLDDVNAGILRNNETIITNSRHYDALIKSLEEIKKVQHGMQEGLSGDLLAIDIRQALYHFGEITGEITSDDLLGNIFANFCIGK
ncbi:tRNA uridine-5-carboxymethylaminomethyl(34) synthesis GTPase MnmE [Eudoraea adriatica]|uniref:tRNA uridine-5-carboxymethylaminomethyl(34) synthesis GTPase MnmE n=1 Tax=Eudoraea adriatica TaxID=446681 RepID=UPI0003612C10|nr:tRNA uridine-5-carboxymethylaminomethyl(34) synthesis GTPase MnmE [Eudoraea adriatica]